MRAKQNKKLAIYSLTLRLYYTKGIRVNKPNGGRNRKAMLKEHSFFGGGGGCWWNTMQFQNITMCTNVRIIEYWLKNKLDSMNLL